MSMTAVISRLTLDEEVGQLCAPYTHRERRLVRDAKGKQRAEHHTTEWPSLLDQVRQAAVEPAGQVDDAARRVPDSTPPGNWGAVAALMRVDAGAAEWVSVRLSVPLRPSTEGNIRYLLGAAYGLPAQTSAIGRDVHRWWTWARVESLWETPPRSLGDPCPYCAAQTLRVRPGDTAEGSYGWCTECAATWDGVEVRVLGQIIERARVERAQAARECRDAEREARRLAETEADT
jgi:hypothetical protein